MYNTYVLVNYKQMKGKVTNRCLTFNGVSTNGSDSISWSWIFCCLTVNGSEYAFGAHDFPTSGVFEVEPRQCPGFKFRKAIFMGTTSLQPSEVREFMEQQSRNFHGDAYHLIVKNCNHFCDDICYKLTGKRIPKWVNRLARIGM